MLPLQNDRVVSFLKSYAAASSATATSQTIDTVGFDVARLSFDVNVGTATNTGATLVSIVLQESDSTATDSFSNITGYTAGTATSGWPTQVTVATASTQTFGDFTIDLRARKRYLRAQITTGTVTVTYNTFGLAYLSRAAEAPTGTNTGARFVVNP